MGYISALRKAGATVHAEKFSGDYQGTWLALVTFNGMIGICSGGYGSCGGCDAFQAWRDNFGWSEEPTDVQYAAFAKDYLDSIEPFQDVLDNYKGRTDGWDGSSAEETVAWLESEWKKLSTEIIVAHFIESDSLAESEDAGEKLRDAVKRLAETGYIEDKVIPGPKAESGFGFWDLGSMEQANKRGFWMIFDNGFRVSVQYGEGSYTDNRYGLPAQDGGKGCFSTNAEVHLYWGNGKGYDWGQYGDPIGWASVNTVMKVLNTVQAHDGVFVEGIDPLGLKALAD